jgi:hypothetical protein
MLLQKGSSKAGGRLILGETALRILLMHWDGAKKDVAGQRHGLILAWRTDSYIIETRTVYFS